MVSIPGASGYLNAATLANIDGTSAVQSSLLDGGLSTPDLLDVGRRINRSNVGLSSNARAIHKRFLSSSSSTFNAIFSLNVGTTSSVEALQQGILALRAKAPQSSLSRAVQEDLASTGDTLSSAAEAEEAAKEASESLSSSSSTVLSSSGNTLDVNA